MPNDDRFYRPKNAPLSPSTYGRECMDCYRTISERTQECNDGRCDDCSDKDEFNYWVGVAPV